MAKIKINGLEGASKMIFARKVRTSIRKFNGGTKFSKLGHF